jgi:hypothetical protein
VKLDFSQCKTREDVERVAKPLGELISALRRAYAEALGPPCTCRARTKKLGWWHADECPRFVPREAK